MPQVKEITEYLESIAPLDYQESYDNAGLLTGNPAQEVSGVLTTLDAVEAVVDEAIAQQCNMIVAHHPIIFKGLKKLTGSNHVERSVIKALQNDIAIYATHTNLDHVPEGVNRKISEQLGLQDLQILSPRAEWSTDNRTIGAGMLGKLSEAMEEKAFLKHLQSSMQLTCFRHTPLLNKPVSNIAVCGGAGGFVLPEAKAQGAEVLVTSDFKYHEFFNAENEILIADIGHYESEKFTKDLLQEWISEAFPALNVRVSSVNTNPVHYYGCS